LRRDSELQEPVDAWTGTPGDRSNLGQDSHCCLCAQRLRKIPRLAQGSPASADYVLCGGEKGPPESSTAQLLGSEKRGQGSFGPLSALCEGLTV
jgi:hypothetical protein